MADTTILVQAIFDIELVRESLERNKNIGLLTKAEYDDLESQLKVKLKAKATAFING